MSLGSDLTKNLLEKAGLPKSITMWKKYPLDQFLAFLGEIKAETKQDDETFHEFSDELLDYEIQNFLLIDTFTENCGCIVKRDIFRLINRLTNEIIGNHLNQLVEKGCLTMCWDDQYDEFIWRPTPKE